MSDQASDDPTPTGAQVNHHFVGLVLSLHSSAWIHLGKVTNPATNKTELNLEAAREVIDLLGALEEKSRGNRVEEEDRLMTQILTELRMNYVDELERAKKDKSAEANEAAGSKAASDESAEPDESARSEESAESKRTDSSGER